MGIRKIVIILGMMALAKSSQAQMYNVRTHTSRYGNTAYTNVSVNKLNVGMADDSRVFLGIGNGANIGGTWALRRFSLGYDIDVGFGDKPISFGALTLFHLNQSVFVGASIGASYHFETSTADDYDGSQIIVYETVPSFFSTYISGRIGVKVHRNLDLYFNASSSKIYSIGIAILIRKKKYN